MDFALPELGLKILKCQGLGIRFWVSKRIKIEFRLRFNVIA